ncbi:MAG TPA: NYN domain-containing protein [Chitinophagales bacterium]|nr:NYN domain-containing protein [Chitinophagales bacterium]HMU68978.1 NYN domain-containing protein [Chitinophagales bacterium]HMX04901.1 NYN domain-containing protein [Chitinophagales bacterium]HMZ90303.1 NYN domain-containing protein [Chitinophagales bacterium]HNE47273.1 NYN domain-containing protein [Chitinophagales bacterium]
MAIRTTFYIDGFNFYNGIKSASKSINKDWKKYYWIDFVKFCQLFLTDSHELVKVKYFSAPPFDSGKQSRQSALFKANKIINGDKLSIINGKYYKKPITCMASCKETFHISEEKRTDVNISVEMIGDCAFNNTDLIVLISADSDLVPPIEYVIKKFPDKKVKVYFPPKRSSYDLKSMVNNNVVYLDKNEGKFKAAIMPDLVSNGVKHVNKPELW